jgi:hypothetical protein
MITNWSVDEIKQQIQNISFAESDPYMDGFNTWKCKKDLYELLWYIEQRLQTCSTYAGEDQFVKEYQMDQMIDILKK